MIKSMLCFSLPRQTIARNSSTACVIAKSQKPQPRSLGCLSLMLFAAAGIQAQMASSPSAPATQPHIHLISPMADGNTVTSSFGERRLTHLHSGYDFSTDEQIGWPVRAAADGEIFRLKIEKRGYGRAIYLRHADGFSTNYGHLFAYEEATLKLESRVRAEQKKNGRYPGDIYFEPPIQVKAGDIIAYSGEAGVGMPHLHFELRLGDAPVDPRVYSDLPFSAPGELKLMALLILPPAGAGSAGAQHIPLTRRGDGVFVPGPGAVTLPADARLAFEAWEQAPGHRRSLTSLEFRLDGAPWYKLAPDTFDFHNYFEAGWIYNPALSESGRYVLNLIAPVSDPSILQFRGVSFGHAPLPDGAHTFSIAARGLRETARAEIAFTTGPARAPAAMPGTAIEVAAGRQWNDGPWRLQLPEGGLPGGELRVVTSPAPRQTGLVATAINGVEFSPDDFYTRETMTLSVKTGDPAHADIYYWDTEHSRWEAMTAAKGMGMLSVKTRGLGRFAVFTDKTPPVIGAFAQRSEPRLNLVRYYWPVTDAGEGIEVDGCEAEIAAGNGSVIPEEIEIEFDPDHDWAEFFRPAGWRQSGPITLTCTDRAGNSASDGTSKGRRGRHARHAHKARKSGRHRKH